MGPFAFPCPACGQNLSGLTADIRPGTDVTRDSSIGAHVHVVVSGSATCRNNHLWKGVHDFTLERVS